MLENVVAWVLNNYIGEYLEDLNTDQLSVALLSGQVELENVPLKKTALRKLDLPLEVKSGLLGKLTLSVPITHIRSEPWTLKLSDVLIIVGPLSGEKRYDVEAVEQVEQQRKEQMLEELELRHKTKLLDLCGVPMPQSQDSWWGASLISTVLNNIQLILNNVHIRYEDDTTISGQSFNCGIRIQKMTMQTTNSHWKPGFAEPQKGVNTFKKLELTGFSIYWNSKGAMTENIDDSKQLKEILAPETSTNAYIIQPCSAELRMEKNSSKFPLKAKFPRFKLFMRPDGIGCELTRHQMTELRAVNREWARFERARQHRKWRPLCTVGENAKEWWKFAYNRVLEESRRTNANRTWEFAHERATRFNAYCRAYRKRLIAMIANPNATTTTTTSTTTADSHAGRELAVVPAGPQNQNQPIESIIMKQIERDDQYTYHELHLFRETAFRRLVKDKEKELGITVAAEPKDEEEAFETIEPLPEELELTPEAPEAPPTNGGLYGWITGFFVQAEKDEKVEDKTFDFGNVDVGELKDNVKEMEGEILDVLHESWDDSTLLRRDALLAQISLRLEHLTLRFVDGEGEEQRILALELSGVSSRWELSPKQHSFSVDLTVSDMSVQRLRTGHPRPKSKLAELSESLLYSTAESTKMLLTVGRDGEDVMAAKVPMFSMHYSRKSPRLIVRHTVNCRLRPVSIVYEEGALDGLSTLFTDDPAMFEEILKKKIQMGGGGSIESDDELVDMSITPSSQQLSIIESHVAVNLELPAVRMEVRGRGWTRRELRPSTVWEPGEPIACLNAERLKFSVISKEQHLTSLKLAIGHVEMIDKIENTFYPLLTTSSQTGQLKSFSNSCPDLHKADKREEAKKSKSHHANYAPPIISSSVPNDESFVDYSRPLNLTMMSTITSATSIDGAPTPPIPAATTPSTLTSSKDVKPEVTIRMTLVDKQHLDFERKHKKRNCSIEIDMDEMEMQMNRRTWTALLEMGGILGEDEHERQPDEFTQIQKTSIKSAMFRVGCTLRAKNWRVGMPYPRNGTRLGCILLANTELESTMELSDSNSNTMAMKLMVDGMRIEDSMPCYSEFYPERLIMLDETAEQSANTFGASPKRRLEESKRITIDVVKYLGEDPSRECDVSIRFHVPPNQKFYYVHTHRFFCALLDFWMQFNELMNLVTKSKKIKVEEGVRAKCALDVDVQCATSLIMPMNSTSSEMILWQADSMRMKNTFRTLSSLKAEIFEKYSVESDYGFDPKVDCLLDYGDMVLSNMRAHEARQIDRLHNQKNFHLIGEKAFQQSAFVLTSPNVFSRRFDLNNKFLRNLDTVFSKNAPDMTIITRISGLKWRMSTQFYILMRGVLERNLGEMMIPIPETIPTELLQLPEHSVELGSHNKYATLSFRLVFEDVDLNLEVPKKVGVPGEWAGFANVKLESARVSFDAFDDGQSELDLICERIELVDTTGNKNCFPVILQHTDAGKGPRPAAPTTHLHSSLMLETHIMMKKDECPVLTLVLCNARVILAYDWLDDFKQFWMLYTDFVPKYSDEIPYNAHRQSSIVERHPHPTSSSLLGRPTFSVKITLRDSDLYIMENPTVKNSFALIASTTAVLNMNDTGGNISANLEIQSMRLGWCAMQHEKQTRNLCSNDFSTTISLNVEPVEVKGKGMAVTPPVRHALEIEIVKMICRLSYKDARALKAIVTGYSKSFAEFATRKSLIPVIVPPPPAKPLEIGKYVIRTEHADLWILDDLQSNSIPLLRFSAANVFLEKAGERIKSSFHVSMDYFNQRIFGWEPVIEEWRILRFLSNSKDSKQTVELVAETKSTLNLNVTEQLIQQSIQWNAKLPAILASFERDDFRNQCTRSSSDHLPYVMKNATGCEVHFTTAVEDVLSARSLQRKSSTRWITVARGQEKNFEFPARLLLYSHLEREPPRQLIVRVSGWDEISPVNVDSCGTYFRVVKAIKPELKNARLLISVTMEKDGKKVVTLKSSIDVTNHLPHPIAVQTEGATSDGELMSVEPNGVVAVPLQFAHCTLTAYPVGPVPVVEHAELSWKKVKISGEVCNQTQRLKTRSDSNLNRFYWVCMAIRREYYPEHEFESLPGHSIHLVAPLSLQNLLPIDVEIKIQDNVFAIVAGKSMLITSVDITKELAISVSTDRLQSISPLIINKAAIGEGALLSTKMTDSNGHLLDMYCHVRLGVAQSLSVSLWVPYWVVNKSGLPLIIQQDAVKFEAAGQMEEHEKAKDRHPLMFSFADENCPKACRVRLGNAFIREKGYRPMLSDKFTLTPGVQALKLRVEHKTLPTIYYNLGVEVRAGTGRYKDTQVVLLTSRFVLQNQSSVALSVAHHDLVEKEKEHVHLAAQSSTTWNENYAARRMLCVRRADVKHWSCPFLIDRIGSFHVTMRDADETPRFIRVEIILTSAVFQITFTNADFYPPPIRIENLTDVPVLYQQESSTPARPHLRTICKSKSVVDYAWDDLYGPKKMVLQVFENRSKSYEIGVPGPAEPLVYENSSFIQLAQSFLITRTSGADSGAGAQFTDEQELVLETMQKGKVMLNKQNRAEDNQLWKLCPDGCIENVGMNHRKRADSRMVLDVLEKTGGRLMMMERDQRRNRWQRWTWMPDGRLCLIDNPSLMMTSKQTEVVVVEADKLAPKGEDGVAVTQIWRVQRQRPGSGTLGVEFLHSGPTVVIRITDRELQTRAVSEPMIQAASRIAVVDVSITMRGGIGISVVNGLQEELIYAHFGGIVVSARRIDRTYQMTGSVDVIQIDNQLLSSDRWQVLYCQSDPGQNFDETMEVPAGVAVTERPALKLEMNCTPMKHYDSFDCFRLKVCDMSVQLDELLLWKIVQMAQSSNASSSVQQRSLNLPPNTELERHDPLRTRRWYFGTLDLEMGHVGLSVVTVSKSGLPRDLRLLKQQFNVKLISFENASVALPPFRQFHYFETSSFLLETLQKFYMAELQKQTLSIIVTLDAFGNPLGLVTDLKDSFQGLFIEGDVKGFVAGVGYGLSNSVSKVASSMASGVGALTFDQDHELKRRHNMIRSHSSSSTPLTHLYSGVKGLGVGVLGGATAMFTNVGKESRKSGIVKGMVWGMATGVVDTVTKPVQGVFDFVEGTASAMKELAMPATGVRRAMAQNRVRTPRLCRNLYHLLPAYNSNLAHAQIELLRINGYSAREQLLDVETCLEHIDGAHVDRIIRQYVLISTKQCYVCRQTNGENSIVIQRIAYKFLKNVVAKPPLENTFSSIEVTLDMEDTPLRQLHVWCSRIEVARRLADKMLRAKQLYDHNKRTLNDVAWTKSLFDSERGGVE